MGRKFEFILAIIFATASFCEATNLIVNGDFETAESIPAGRPSGVGYWEGDACEIVTASADIIPFEGDRMLQFIYSDLYGPSGCYNTSDLWQLVDVSPFRDMVNTANAVATLSAHFNRVLGDSETDTKFSILIFAFAGEPSTFLFQVHEGNQLAGQCDLI